MLIILESTAMQSVHQHLLPVVPSHGCCCTQTKWKQHRPKVFYYSDSLTNLDSAAFYLSRQCQPAQPLRICWKTKGYVPIAGRGSMSPRPAQLSWGLGKLQVAVTLVLASWHTDSIPALLVGCQAPSQHKLTIFICLSSKRFSLLPSFEGALC